MDIFFYSLPGTESDDIRRELDADRLTYRELRLDHDDRLHRTGYPGVPVVVIAIDGVAWEEFSSPYIHIKMKRALAAAPSSLPAKPEPARSRLSRKPSAQWNMSDIAEWLKASG